MSFKFKVYYSETIGGKVYTQRLVDQQLDVQQARQSLTYPRKSTMSPEDIRKYNEYIHGEIMQEVMKMKDTMESTLTIKPDDSPRVQREKLNWASQIIKESLGFLQKATKIIANKIDNFIERLIRLFD